MTIQYLDSQRLTGVASDTKPTTLSDHSIFIETDTGKRFIFDGGRWKRTSVFDSLHESFTNDKQRFVEWFSGKQIPSYWNTNNTTGTGTFAMADTVDGGFIITSGTGANYESNINFNNKRQYAHDGSVMIGVVQAVATSGSDVFMSLSNDATAAAYLGGDNTASWEIEGGTQYCNTSDGTSVTRTALTSATAMGTGFRVGKVECGTANIKLTVDGVLEVVKTTNRPASAMQPKFSVFGNGKALSVKYMEAYNT